MKAATGEVVSAEDLGGADVHTRISGVADHLAENDAHALAIARRIVKDLNWQKPAGEPGPLADEPSTPAEELYGVIPSDSKKPFRRAEIIARLVDEKPISTNSRPVTAARWSAVLRLHLRLPGGHRRQ